MIQANEIINLLMGLAAIPALFLLSRYGRLPRLPLLYAGYTALMGAYVFTIVEGFVWGDLFNALEHLSLALAGLLFCAAFHQLPEALGREEGGP